MDETKIFLTCMKNTVGKIWQDLQIYWYSPTWLLTTYSVTLVIWFCAISTADGVSCQHFSESWAGEPGGCCCRHDPMWVARHPTPGWVLLWRWGVPGMWPIKQPLLGCYKDLHNRLCPCYRFCTPWDPHIGHLWGRFVLCLGVGGISNGSSFFPGALVVPWLWGG